MRSELSGNSRRNRVRRWIEKLPKDVGEVRAESFDPGEQWSLVAIASTDDAQRAADTLCDALQDAADSMGRKVSGRVAAEVDGRTMSQAVTLKPDPASGTETPVEDMDGTPMSQVAQMQRHNEALLRLGISERLDNRESMHQVLAAQGKVIDKLGDLLERAYDREDDLVQQRQMLMDALLEPTEDEDTEEKTGMPPEMQALAVKMFPMLASTFLSGKRSQKKKGRESNGRSSENGDAQPDGAEDGDSGEPGGEA